jgi:hypothetical protein
MKIVKLEKNFVLKTKEKPAEIFITRKKRQPDRHVPVSSQKVIF